MNQINSILYNQPTYTPQYNNYLAPNNQYINTGGYNQMQYKPYVSPY